MIQRIQTLFLLIALAFGVSMFFSSPLSFTGAETTHLLNFKGVINTTSGTANENIPTMALTILLIMAPLLELATILLFKKRLIQIRLCAANIGLLLGTTGLIYYFGTLGVKELNATVSYGVTMVFPIAGAILNFLAIRGIGKDEALIRSMDRIR